MRTKNIIILIVICMGWISCTKDEIDNYGDVNYIYLEASMIDDEFPSQNFSFVFEDEDVTRKIINIPVKVSGKMISEERSFSVEIVDSLTTATENVHYSINESEQIIPGNSEGGNIQVHITKTDDMSDSLFQVGIKIVDNNNFKATFSKVFVLKFSAFFAEPDWWYTKVNTYPEWPSIGEFTVVKALLWLEYHDITDGTDPWDNDTYKTSYSRPPYFYPKRQERKTDVAAFRLWLTQHPDAPLYDENGDLVLDTL